MSLTDFWESKRFTQPAAFISGLADDVLLYDPNWRTTFPKACSLLVLPALAVNQYKGVAAAWRLTKCSFERLLALEAIAHLPYLIALAVLAGLTEPYYPLAYRAAVNVAQCVAWMFGQAFVVGVIALAYQHASLRGQIVDRH